MSKAYDLHKELTEVFQYEITHRESQTFKILAPKTLLFLALSAISFIGLFTMCAFLPWRWGFSIFSFFISLRILIPGVISLGMVAKAFSLHINQNTKIRYLRDRISKTEKALDDTTNTMHRSLLFLLFMDDHLWNKAHNGDTGFFDYPYDSPCTKDIPLGLVLQHLHALNSSKEIARRELSNALADLEEHAKCYAMLRKLDSVILKHIPEIIRSKHEKAVYSLRFNLLKFVFDALEKDEYSSFEYNDKNDLYYIESNYGVSQRKTKYRWKDKPIIDFFIMVLNEFYANDYCYEHQYHEFDEEVFESFFFSTKATGVLAKNDLQETIKSYENSIKEIEDEIADLQVQTHDLQIVLDVFFAEYNSKVGILYVDLDRIKLKIKEYKKRLELAEGKTITEEEAQEIEDEIDSLFSDAREKVDDLEDEATESSEEYEKHKEEEENAELFGEDFLKELKKLFRKLVFKFHPDMAENEEQKKEFHTIFIKIKEAYEKRDIEVLQQYMLKADIESKKDDETPEKKLVRLEKEYERLTTIYEKLKANMETMRKSELYLLKKRVEEAREDGEDLLQDLVEAAEREIDIRREELDELREKYHGIIAQSV